MFAVPGSPESVTWTRPQKFPPMVLEGDVGLLYWNLLKDEGREIP